MINREPPIIRDYREQMARQYKNWVESMYISVTEFGGNFGTSYQTLNKIYDPVTKAGARTIALVSYKGFTGKTNTLLEIEIDGAGNPPAATFKWRKETLLGRAFGSWTTGVATGADIEVTDGIHINFNDTGYVVGDEWHLQACGSWHTPEDGINSYFTSLYIYPFDVAKDPKAGLFRAWCGEYRIIDFVSKQGEFPNWRTPIYLKGDGTVQFKIELAELTAGDIEHMCVIAKGWDE